MIETTMRTLRETITEAASTDEQRLRRAHRGVCMMNVMLSSWIGQHRIKNAHTQVEDIALPEDIARPGRWSLLPEEFADQIAGFADQKERIMDMYDYQARSDRAEDNGRIKGVYLIRVEDKEDCTRLLKKLAEVVAQFGSSLSTETQYRKIIEHIAGKVDKKLLSDALRRVPPRESIADRYRLTWRSFVVDNVKGSSLEEEGSVVVDQLIDLIRCPRERVAAAATALHDCLIDPTTGKMKNRRCLKVRSVENFCKELDRVVRSRESADHELIEAVRWVKELFPNEPEKDAHRKKSTKKEIEWFVQDINRNTDSNRKLVKELASRLLLLRTRAMDVGGMIRAFNEMTK